MHRLFFPVLSALLFICSPVFSQNKPGKSLSIAKALGTITIDGTLEENDWKTAVPATDFFLNYPVDSLPPSFQTEARLTFDDHFLYVSFVCYDDDRPSVVQSLRRDIDWELNDNVGMYLDPFNDFTNGFYFTITPYGVQSEGIMAYGGSDPQQSFNNNWDNKWYSAVKRLDDRWVAELAIPFKSFRYNQKEAEWNVTFLRQDLKRNQVSSWIATPIQFIPASFAYSGRLQWQTPAPHAGTNISLIPYAVAGISKDKENGTAENTANVGFDAKLAITPSLNLDLTVNPDFSTVEVDRQVINLTRFEFQFPERRQFFLENSDLFSAPGFTSLTQPFFSRRIGLASDSADNLTRVPILYGARISGKLGSKWRVGLMNLQTKETKSLGLPGQNYAVAVMQKQIFERSNFDVFLVNKQSIGLGEYDQDKYYHESLVKEVWNGTDSVPKLNTYNRVAGVDFNLITANNKWGGKAYYHHSFDNFSESDCYSFGGFASYNTRNISLMSGFIGLGKNYNAEVGFVPNLPVYPGVLGGIVMADLKLYPQSESIVLLQPGFTFDTNYIPDGTLTDRNVSLRYAMNFSNTAMLTASVRNIFQKLPADFDVLDPEGDAILLEGEEYQWNEVELKFNSNSRNLFTYILTASGGEFYNGTRMGVGGTLSYRVQPFGSISLSGDYNHIELPPAYGSATFLLISPRLDFTFTDKLFLTTFVQYNDRYDNVNLNARFQWRYKPASDFFIVYTENYFPEYLKSKNRALVLKFTYWLNI
ncbi:MAG: carbohydrate binding family 9 domain-containing protein [Cyclobacteriaceae bacterium]|nr:carbohydrate binding family 9 domain-containing protein [Cyclobacteriaceae bacterium]